MNMAGPCPGLYCGRIYQNFTLSECTACPRGFRANSLNSICELCTNDLQLYDWIYLLFMVVIFVLIELYFIDKCTKSNKLNFITIIFYLTIIGETVISSILSIMSFNPIWQLNLKTCSVKSFSDWYTLFYNPSIDQNFYCTHEAVYPLYSIVFVFYLISLGLVLTRPLYLRMISFIVYLLTSSNHAKNLYSKDYLTKNVYYVLYSIPALMFTHAMFAGVIYYIFPYLLIIGSVISIAIHFSYHINQSYRYLLRAMFQFRTLSIILCHWSLHAFGIISLTELKNVHDYFLFILIPFPTFFYIFTSKFSDPSKL